MAQQYTKEDFIRMAHAAGAKYGLPAGALPALIEQESGFNPNAVSKAGAVGIAQFMPATAKRFGIDPKDPVQAIDAAGKYMQQHMSQFGNLKTALQAYNAGEGRMANHLKGVGAPLKAETLNYAPAIMARMSKYAGGVVPQAGQAMASTKVPPTPQPAASANVPEGHIPVAPVTLAGKTHLAIPDNPQEFDLMSQITAAPYDDAMKSNMTKAMAQVLPAHSRAMGKPLFEQDMPTELDKYLEDIIKVA